MSKSESGVGFFGLLALLFIALKLTHQIDWDWLWVLSPIWGPVATSAAVLLTVGILGLFFKLIKKVVDTIRGRRKANAFLRCKTINNPYR